MEAILISLWMLPFWYLNFLELVPSANVLEMVAWVGFVGLWVGVAWGTVKQQAALCWFAVSPLLSHVMLAIVLLFGRPMEMSSAHWLNSGFLLVQVAIMGYLVFRLKGMRVPALSLSVFGLSYALFAAFVSGMALTNTWL